MHPVTAVLGSRLWTSIVLLALVAGCTKPAATTSEVSLPATSLPTPIATPGPTRPVGTVGYPLELPGWISLTVGQVLECSSPTTIPSVGHRLLCVEVTVTSLADHVFVEAENFGIRFPAFPRHAQVVEVPQALALPVDVTDGGEVHGRIVFLVPSQASYVLDLYREPGSVVAEISLPTVEIPTVAAAAAAYLPLITASNGAGDQWVRDVNRSGCKVAKLAAAWAKFADADDVFVEAVGDVDFPADVEPLVAAFVEQYSALTVLYRKMAGNPQSLSTWLAVDRQERRAGDAAVVVRVALHLSPAKANNLAITANCPLR